MNLPNFLTLVRVIMSPLFLAVLLMESTPHSALYALLLFSAACITDALDGRLARKNNQITDFGKFLDPLADKMLTTAALLGFVKLGMCSVWIPMVVLSREFMVMSVRLTASSRGKVIAANFWGKFKTVAQMVAIILVLVLLEVRTYNVLPVSFPYSLVSNILLWVSTLFTVGSGIQYVWLNRRFIKVK